MTIKELINQLESAASELGYDAEVRTGSHTHVCTLHHITRVESESNGKAYIYITD